MACSRSRTARAALLLGLLVWGCRPGPSSDAVHLEPGTRNGERILAVIPAAGFRINARVPPTLELGSGGILRLATGRVLPDSSYFVEPPWAPRPPGVPLRGVLRVSFCRDTERLCRIAAIPVDLRD